MITKNQIASLVKTVKNNTPKRNFKQSFEIIVALKDIDFKKQNITINEVIQLPYYSGQQAKICFICGGDLALRAKKAGVDAEVIKQAHDQHLKAHILWEFWTAENSDGFHNPQMARESLTKSVDESQKGIKILDEAMAPKPAAATAPVK